MLKRLRRRFVAIIMVLVGSVLVGVAVVNSYNVQASFDDMVNISLDRVLDAKSATLDDGSGGMGMKHLPVLWVDFSSDGIQLGSNQSQLSIDANAFDEALSSALSSTNSFGRIEESHITWRSSTMSWGTRIAFADTSSIDVARSSQLLSGIAITFAALALLFLIAELLSRWMLAPVEKAWEQQHQFVADASHELKTPLAVILANTQILTDDIEVLPEESRRWVLSTSEEAARMKGLVEGLLELARTEDAGGSARQNVDVDFSSVVEDEALQFDAVAYEQGCSIEAQVSEGIHVMGDTEQLTRLVKTLLDNACKYASKGSVVDVRLVRQGSAVEYSVTNQGEPIPAEDLPHLFDRFYRSDKARTRETGGFGLGLAIAKGIVESHGGKISVTSDAASGTRFCVRLPTAGRAS